MIEEDRSIERLKGNNVLIKFKDGEELFLNVEEICMGGPDEDEWFENVDAWMNQKDIIYFPIEEICVAKDSVKYIKKI